MKRALFAASLIALTGPALAQAPQPRNTTNATATITSGNSFQNVVTTAASSRKALTIQNNNTNGDNCWLFIGSASATKGTSILLAPGASYQRYYPYIPADTIQATCTTTNDTLYIDL